MLAIPHLQQYCTFLVVPWQSQHHTHTPHKAPFNSHCVLGLSLPQAQQNKLQQLQLDDTHHGCSLLTAAPTLTTQPSSKTSRYSTGSQALSTNSASQPYSWSQNTPATPTCRGHGECSTSTGQSSTSSRNSPSSASTHNRSGSAVSCGMHQPTIAAK